MRDCVLLFKVHFQRLRPMILGGFPSRKRKTLAQSNNGPFSQIDQVLLQVNPIKTSKLPL